MRPDDATSLFITRLRGLRRTRETIAWYRVLIHRFECFANGLGVRHWSDVSLATLVAYQQHVTANGNRRGQPYSIPVRNLHLTVIRALLGYLYKVKVISQNPTALLQFAREPTRLPKPVVTVRDMERLLASPDLDTTLGFRDRTIMEVFYSTGIRVSELVHLRLQDLDLDEGILLVRKGKGGRDRAVPFGRVAGRCLRVYLDHVRSKILGNRPDPAHVFLTPRGCPYTTRALWERIVWYSNRAQLGGRVTPHMFRHAFATHMIQNHANVRLVQEMLGHAKMRTTERYVSLTITDLQSAHRRFHPRDRNPWAHAQTTDKPH